MAQTASFTNTSNDIALPTIVRQAANLMRERLEAYRARARMRAELNTYSDRELSDMGLSRSDIEDVVHFRYAR
jgi:uncharacterized protein YjiS (DUF1127 family)